MPSCVAAFGEVSARVSGTTHNTHKHYLSMSVCKYANLLFFFFYKKKNYIIISGPTSGHMSDVRQ